MALYHTNAMLNSYLLNDLSIHRDTVIKLGFLDAMWKLTLELTIIIVSILDHFILG